MGKVGLLAGGIHHHIEPARQRRARDHQIVENAAVFSQQLRITLLQGRKTQKVGGDQGLHGLGRTFKTLGRNEALPHVRHVEQARVFARPGVFAENSCGVLHRHFVAGERHHSGLERNMRIVKRCAQDLFGQFSHS